MIAIERPALADATALSQFAVGAFVDTFGPIYAPADLRLFLAEWNTVDQLDTQIADPDWLIAMVRGGDGAIAGFAKLGPLDLELPDGQPSADSIELYQLYVAAAAKGTGVARALMDWAIDRSRARAAILYLSVFTENRRAQAFYRRYGFVDVGRNAFRVGNHIDEDRIWRLDL